MLASALHAMSFLRLLNNERGEPCALLIHEKLCMGMNRNIVIADALAVVSNAWRRHRAELLRSSSVARHLLGQHLVVLLLRSR